MDLWRHLEPRDVALARHGAAALCAMAAIVAVLFEVVLQQRGELGARLVTAGVSIALLALAWAMVRAPDHLLRWFWFPVPVLGVATITGLDLATGDATAGGQVFFCFPVLYAASQLRLPAATVVTVLAIIGDGIVAFSLLPPADAVKDFFYVGTALASGAVVLGLAGHRMDQLVAKLRHLAEVDPLTGLATRRVLDEALGSALAGAGQRTGTALLVVDVDRFKEVNDGHGHPVGDLALQHVAGILVTGVRPDTVVSRMGGDELAVLLPRCSAALALQRAQHLVESVRGTPLLLPDGTLLALSVSVGVALAPTHAGDVRELYAAADAALYNAKRGGRDQVGVPV